MKTSKKDMSNKWSILQTGIGSALAVLAFLATEKPARGNIIGSDVVNPDGTVTYSYVIDNTSGSFDVAAWSLEFGFPLPDWNQLDVLSGGQVTVANADWFASGGTPVGGQSAQDFLSLSPTADVKVGHSLSGFSFTSHFLPGEVTYHEFAAAGEATTGTTVGPARSVPEGGGRLATIAFATLLLFAIGGQSRRIEERTH
jgi:hypothetical protein